MGEIILGECITNALQEDECIWTLSSDRDRVQMWEEWKLAADCTVAACYAMAELMEEDKEQVYQEADMEEGSFTGDLAPK